MKKTVVFSLLVSLVVIFSGCTSTPVVTITSGGTGGISYKLGQSIADTLSEAMPSVVIKADAGYGSYAGCVSVQEGRADIAIVESDVAYLAYNGLDEFSDQPCENLRGIAAMYPSALQLVTITGSNIQNITDLAGKRVSLGELNSLSYLTTMHVLQANQISISSLMPYYYSLDDAVLAMENGELDALFFTGGFPNSRIVTLTQTRNIRMVDTVRQPETVQLIASLDSEIYSIEDLYGKKVSMGEEGAVLYNDVVSLIDAYGVSLDRIDQMYMPFSEAIAALKAGTLDAVFVSSNDVDYNFEEITENEDVALVPIDYALLKDTDETPYYSQTLIPAGTYQGMDDSVAALTTTGILVCSADMDEDLVYELTQQFWENAGAIQADSGILYDLIIENAQDGMGIPLHPGAQKYYDEIAKSSK